MRAGDDQGASGEMPEWSGWLCMHVVHHGDGWRIVAPWRCRKRRRGGCMMHPPRRFLRTCNEKLLNRDGADHVHRDVRRAVVRVLARSDVREGNGVGLVRSEKEGTGE